MFCRRLAFLDCFFYTVPPDSAVAMDERSLLVQQVAKCMEHFNLVSTVKMKLEIAHGILNSALNDVMSAEAAEPGEAPPPRLSSLSGDIQQGLADVDNGLWECKRSRNEIMENLTRSMRRNLEPEELPERERTPRRT